MLADIGFLEKTLLLQMMRSLPSFGERNEAEVCSVVFLIPRPGNLKDEVLKWLANAIRQQLLEVCVL